MTPCALSLMVLDAWIYTFQMLADALCSWLELLIPDTLKADGWMTEVQPFEYLGVQSQNLIGRSSNAGQRVIVIAAHYDTRRVADNDPVSPS